MRLLQSTPNRDAQMKTPLPTALALYLQHENADGDGELDVVFAPDAEVRDEGGTIRGHDAIRAWKQAAKARYRYRVQPLSAELLADGRWHLRVHTSGDFPGSPVVLDYRVEMAGGRIAVLEIG